MLQEIKRSEHLRRSLHAEVQVMEVTTMIWNMRLTITLQVIILERITAVEGTQAAEAAILVAVGILEEVAATNMNSVFKILYSCKRCGRRSFYEFYVKIWIAVK